MKTKIHFAFFLLVAIALVLGNVSPSLADDELPPADAADIISLRRVNDLAPGAPSSSPSDMVMYGGNLYFAANANNGYGREIWELGNPIGIDINVGAGSSDPANLTVYNNAIYFTADGGDGAGRELWRFDWNNGAQRVTDINPGGGSISVIFFPPSLVAYNNELYFSAYDGTNLLPLWKYNPVNGAQIVANISAVNNLTVYNNELYFSALDGSGYELWKYNPVNGAQRVTDICPTGSSSPRYVSVYNDALYFQADGCDGTGQELWMYDPLNGAQLVADINIGSDTSYPTDLVVYNGALYFCADGGDGAGRELWKYDPVNGAGRVADIYPGPGSANPGFLAVFNGALYFGANGNDGAGYELWMYNNTAVATFRSVKSYDGWILESGENTNVGGTLNNTANTFNVGDDAQNKQYRGILSFNTSTLPDNAVIISATLRIRKQGLTGTNPFTTHGNIVVDIKNGAFGNDTLQVSDFQFMPSKANAGVIRNQPGANNWFTSILTKAAYPFINPTGVTQFRLRFSKDDNNDNGADFLRFFSADTASMGDYTVLEVKYYIP